MWAQDCEVVPRLRMGIMYMIAVHGWQKYNYVKKKCSMKMSHEREKPKHIMIFQIHHAL